eukprot:scaffold225335_cov33-Tisochrysis_lutea.AAC.1
MSPIMASHFTWHITATRHNPLSMTGCASARRPNTRGLKEKKEARRRWPRRRGRKGMGCRAHQVGERGQDLLGLLNPSLQGPNSKPHRGRAAVEKTKLSPGRHT